MLGKNDKGKVKHRMQALFIYYKKSLYPCTRKFRKLVMLTLSGTTTTVMLTEITTKPKTRGYSTKWHANCLHPCSKIVKTPIQGAYKFGKMSFPCFSNSLNSLFHTIIKLKPDVTNHRSSHFGTFLAAHLTLAVITAYVGL